MNEVVNICLYGTYQWVKVINNEQMHHVVKVDACISDEIQFLNEKGIITLGCCCGHGNRLPHVLIKNESKSLAEKMGYKCQTYLYSNHKKSDTLIVYLKTGCKNKKECKEWHIFHHIPCKENLDIVNI